MVVGDDPLPPDNAPQVIHFEVMVRNWAVGWRSSKNGWDYLYLCVYYLPPMRLINPHRASWSCWESTFSLTWAFLGLAAAAWATHPVGARGIPLDPGENAKTRGRNSNQPSNKITLCRREG